MSSENSTPVGIVTVKHEVVYPDMQVGVTPVTDAMILRTERPAGAVTLNGNKAADVSFFADGEDGNAVVAYLRLGFRIQERDQHHRSPDQEGWPGDAIYAEYYLGSCTATLDSTLVPPAGSVLAEKFGSGLLMADQLTWLAETAGVLAYLNARWSGADPVVLSANQIVGRLGFKDLGDADYLAVFLLSGATSGANAIVGVGS